MHGKNVRPKSWSNVLDLYDDEETSFISGNYGNDQKTSIGMRWNGATNNSDSLGFPNQGNNPTWFVLPEWLRNPILATLADRVKSDSTIGNMANIKQTFDLIN